MSNENENMLILMSIFCILLSFAFVCAAQSTRNTGQTQIYFIIIPFRRPQFHAVRVFVTSAQTVQMTASSLLVAAVTTSA